MSVNTDRKKGNHIIIALAEIWYAHLLWLICSIPVITVGASTTALIYTNMQRRRGKGSIKENFFKSFRQNLVASTVLFVAYAVIGTLLVLGIMKLNELEAFYVILLKILIYIVVAVYALSFVYIFGVQSRFTNTYRDTVMYSIAMAVRNLTSTVPMLMLTGLFIYVNILNRIANILSLIFGFGFLISVFSIYYNRIFAGYMPEEFRTDDEKEAERLRSLAAEEKKRQKQELQNRRIKKSMAEIIEASSNEAEE